MDQSPIVHTSKRINRRKYPPRKPKNQDTTHLEFIFKYASKVRQQKRNTIWLLLMLTALVAIVVILARIGATALIIEVVKQWLSLL